MGVDDHQRNAGDGLAHAAGLNGVGLLVGADNGGLGLAVGVEDVDPAGHVLPGADDALVQRLAGTAAVAQGSGLPLRCLEERPVFVQHQLPIHGGWCAERRDRELVQHLQCALGAECLSVVVDEQRRAAVPRAEERPRRLRPPLLRQVPVDFPW